MLGRIDLVMAAGQHRHRAAREAGAMRRLIDAARQPRGNDKTGLAEIARQRACEFQAGAGGVARADDRDHRPHQHLQRAAHAEQRRRIVQHRKPRRITGFARREQADAEFLGWPQVRRAHRPRCRSGPAVTRRRAAPDRAAAPARLPRCRNDGAASKCARADIVGADQPQPVDPLGVGELVRAVVHAAPSLAQEEIAINGLIGTSRVAR